MRFSVPRECIVLAAAVVVAASLPGLFAGAALGLPQFDDTGFEVEFATWLVYEAAVVALGLLYGAAWVRARPAPRAVGLMVALMPGAAAAVRASLLWPRDGGGPDPAVAAATIRLALSGLLAAASFALALLTFTLGLHVLAGLMDLRADLRRRAVWVGRRPGDDVGIPVAMCVGAVLDGLFVEWMVTPPGGWREELANAFPRMGVTGLGLGLAAFCGVRLAADGRALWRIGDDAERTALAGRGLAVAVSAAVAALSSIVCLLAWLMLPCRALFGEAKPPAWLPWVAGFWALFLIAGPVRPWLRAACVGTRGGRAILAASVGICAAALLGQGALLHERARIDACQGRAPVGAVIHDAFVTVARADRIVVMAHAVLLNGSHRPIVVNGGGGMVTFGSAIFDPFDVWADVQIAPEIVVPARGKREMDFTLNVPSRWSEPAIRSERFDYRVDLDIHFVLPEDPNEATVHASLVTRLRDSEIAQLAAAAPF